ncbi:NUDIX hydrolase [Priestia aryabhattai]
MPELWSVPPGGIDSSETYEECCIREVWKKTIAPNFDG